MKALEGTLSTKPTRQSFTDAQVVVDLAARLALGTTERARSARVVVVDGGPAIGLLVDGVCAVLRRECSRGGAAERKHYR